MPTGTHRDRGGKTKGFTSSTEGSWGADVDSQQDTSRHSSNSRHACITTSPKPELSDIPNTRNLE
eukprot:4414082-Amphidinium_carterae.3